MKKTSKAQETRKKKLLFLSLIAVIIILAVVLVIFYIVPTMNVKARDTRIHAIYNSLKLDTDKYLVQDEDIFGEKRGYEHNAGRTYSSSREYIRAADVDTTVTELKKAITGAGFAFVEDAYPGSAFVQYHYKSDKGEYVRMTVSSKLRNDTIQNKVLMKMTPSDSDYDTNIKAGPSDVIIKVNLDDNNE